MVGILDPGIDWEVAPEGPGWSLMETDGNGALTGRAISALHKSLLATQPSGADGNDLWE